MAEAGGAAAQAGFHYQNSVAALMLGNLLDFDPHPAQDRVVEVRVEAPEHVDDVVVLHADGHRDFLNVKLTLARGTSAWRQMWLNLELQRQSLKYGSADRLLLVIGDESADTRALQELVERVRSYVDLGELKPRLSNPLTSIFDSVADITGSGNAAFELLRITFLRHLGEHQIQTEFSRKRLAGGQAPPPSLLPILRDIAGAGARRRGLFRSAPLRRKLKLEHLVDLAEPPEWGLQSYRAMVADLSRIAIPGMHVSGSSEELFVWPRAKERDLSRQSDFEDERVGTPEIVEVSNIDLSDFPSEQLDRLIVVAGPGYGKTALLTAISGRLSSGPFVPVLLPLAALATSDTSVVDFVESYISAEMDLRADWRRLAEQGLLVLLFDGLDEVPAQARTRLQQRIANFSARYSRTPWILTVRDAAVVAGLSDAKVVDLLPLNDEDVLRFIRAMRKFVHPRDEWQVLRRLKLYPDLERWLEFRCFWRCCLPPLI